MSSRPLSIVSRTLTFSRSSSSFVTLRSADERRKTIVRSSRSWASGTRSKAARRWSAGTSSTKSSSRSFVTEIPAGSAGNATYAFTVCYGVSPEAGDPDASWAAVDFLTGPEGAQQWTDAFNVMPARPSLRDGWLAGHPELEAFLNGADYARAWQFAPGFADVTNEFNTQFGALIAGDIDVDQFVDAVTDAGDSVLG